MEALLKSLQLGFILRSLFAGAYSVLAFVFAEGGTRALGLLHPSTIYSIGVPASVLVGVTVYTLHRSVVYPLLEHLLNSTPAIRARRRFPLISKNTLSVLKKLWCAGTANDNSNEAIARHVGTWADYTHLQYASAVCLALGSIARAWSDPAPYSVSVPLTLGITVFFLAGLFSDWRLHSVREALGFGEEPSPVLAKP